MKEKKRVPNYGFKTKATMDIVKKMFPVRCAGCGARTTEPKFCFCPDCFSHVILCHNEPESAVFHAAIYQGPLQKAILAFKYAGRKFYARPFAALLADVFNRHEIRCDLIIPVPLHWRKEFSRGFNQTAFLAIHLGKLTNLPVSLTLLRKKKNTQPQAGLHESQRRENLKGSFTVTRPVSLKGKNILLIDDVCTTGATVREATSVLRKGGSARVTVLTLAKSV